MKQLDAVVRDFLRRRGCAAHVVDAGLAGLVQQWERIAGEIEGGYRAGLDDYRNDLDCRQILADVLQIERVVVPGAIADRIAAADARVRAATTASAQCAWGARVAARRGFTVQQNWWYFVVPSRAGRELQADLERIGSS